MNSRISWTQIQSKEKSWHFLALGTVISVYSLHFWQRGKSFSCVYVWLEGKFRRGRKRTWSKNFAPSSLSPTAGLRPLSEIATKWTQVHPSVPQDRLQIRQVQTMRILQRRKSHVLMPGSLSSGKHEFHGNAITEDLQQHSRACYL